MPVHAYIWENNESKSTVELIVYGKDEIISVRCKGDELFYLER